MTLSKSCEAIGQNADFGAGEVVSDFIEMPSAEASAREHGHAASIVKEDAGMVEQAANTVLVPLIDEISEAADAVQGEGEARAVLCALSHTPGLDECPIAPEVLAKLLPDEEIVVLPRLACVGGGPVYRIVKRAFDVLSCSVALAVLAIPMAVIAVMVRCESPGSAIYAQTRLGKSGKPFKVYKFRSMYTDAEVRGAQWAEGDDPRVTFLGGKLRNSRLDELPQFWNVIRGDMSLIGPRPERPVFHDAFCQRIDGWEQRLAVRPGITGLAQVEGGYELLPKEKALLDIEYIENRSILLDLKIMFRTLGVMRTGEGSR